MTVAERRLWAALRNKHTGHKFRRQVPLGPYIADFLCHEAKFIVEVDGGHHLESVRDAARDKWFRARGWEVARYWNPDVLADLPATVADIRRRLEARSASSSEVSPTRSTRLDGGHDLPSPACAGEGRSALMGGDD
jgi:BirA family biotin operon repressor/biotin-[acetyl-CoA-carboxylase] ligase